jgi:hypothetical protein
VRIEFPVLATGGASAPVMPTTTTRRRRLDRVELACLIAFVLFSLWVVGLDLRQAIVHGLVWTGTDGFFIVDQMQYLAWIQSASHHLLIANLFVLRGTPSDYFQPAVALSGVIAALGVAPWLALLLWKPVAVVTTFFAARAWAYRGVAGVNPRRVMIVLCLFFASFSSVYGAFGIVGDMMPTWQSWGYPFGLLAVALIVFALLGYDRARGEGKITWIPGVLGGVASALHPWQGETLILILVLAELIRWREHRTWRSLGLPVVTLLLTGIPLAYYLLLGHLDLSWSLARVASKHTFSFWAIAIGALPLALVALLGYRGRPRTFLELLARVWPIVALIIYVLSATALSATPLHAFNGITFPLSMLAVIGVQRTRWAELPAARLATVVLVLAFTIPANAYALAVAHKYVSPAGGNANFITRDERDALAYLQRDPDDGGVLTQFYLGEVVPGRTGRHTLVGDCLWSEPRCMPRSEAADALFTGAMSRAQARRFVIRSKARFILASCAPHVDLQPLLGPLVVDVRRFGCAAVYDLGPPPSSASALANSSLDAAVRPPRRQ